MAGSLGGAFKLAYAAHWFLSGYPAIAEQTDWSLFTFRVPLKV
jgi:hypothetical protein